MSLQNKKNGFTLVELTIAITIALLILLIVSATFVLNQRVFRKSNLKSELTQNARITLDLMAREVRQAQDVVTTLPENDSNPQTIAHEIEFEDGHITSQIQYIRYYLDNSNLQRQIVAYYFDTDPSTYVYWDDIDAFGSPEMLVLEEKTIGENFSDISFYGTDNININLTLEKQNERIRINTVINPRNI